MSKRVAAAVQVPGSPKERTSRGLAAALGGDQETAGHVADAAELAVGVGVVLLNLHVHAPMLGLDSTDMAEQLSITARALTSAMGDLLQAGPTGPLLLSGLLGAVKSLPSKELGALDHDEALLFARSFHSHGCSQALFHKLLACGGCRWANAETGESLTRTSGSHEIKIIVRGKGLIRKAGLELGEASPGKTIDTRRFSHNVALSEKKLEVVAAEPVRYVAWDLHKLEDYLEQTHDKRLIDLVNMLKDDAKSLSSNLGLQYLPSPCRSARTPRGCHSPGDVRRSSFKEGQIGTSATSGWLSPVGAAIHCQARRKGWSHCSQLSDNLQHVLSKPEASLRERLDQCSALVWDSADEIAESFEAVADLAAACSVLAALAGSSADISPDNLLQLGPLVILLSLAGVQAARTDIADFDDGGAADTKD